MRVARSIEHEYAELSGGLIIIPPLLGATQLAAMMKHRAHCGSGSTNDCTLKLAVMLRLKIGMLKPLPEA